MPRLTRLAPVLCLALAACVSAPTEPGDRTKAPRTTAVTSPSPSPAATSAAPSPAPAVSASAAAAVAVPEPLPSMGLIVSGLVTIEANLLLDAKIAEPTAVGARLIGSNGAGLISDKGYGLISNHGGNLTAKVKYGLAQLASRKLLPVQGMIVSAVSLRDGSVLAGPVATDAEGRYHLGFSEAPDSNMRIVVKVTNLESEAKYTYSTLIEPQAKPVLTSDTTRAVADYAVRVIAGRLQRVIDARIAGEDVGLDEGELEVGAKSNELTEKLNKALADISPDAAAILNADGEFARGFAERVLSYADLESPSFAEAQAVIEEMRAFSATLPTAPSPSLIEQAITHASYAPTTKLIVPMLESFGMPSAQAKSIYDRLDLAGRTISNELAQTALENYRASLGDLGDDIVIPNP